MVLWFSYKSLKRFDISNIIIRIKCFPFELLNRLCQNTIATTFGQNGVQLIVFYVAYKCHDLFFLLMITA